MHLLHIWSVIKHYNEIPPIFYIEPLIKLVYLFSVKVKIHYVLKGRFFGAGAGGANRFVAIFGKKCTDCFSIFIALINHPFFIVRTYVHWPSYLFDPD